MAATNGLVRRLEALEAVRAPCGSCRERRGRIYLPGVPVPERCEGCGAAIESRAFTINIDRASGPDGDAA